MNWHHKVFSDAIQEVIDGKVKNLVVNVPPGSTKTEMFVISFIARGLALNPRARFLHLSASNELALLNSQTARDVVQSEEYQRFWRYSIADDSNAKGRWNIMLDGQKAGGVYATSTGGQVTGFRAGHMAPGFQGAIIIDDPLKPEDAFSKPKLDAANRKLLTTIKSRKANPNTPIVLVMQRIGENDPTAFIKAGNLPGKWKFITIPALIDENYILENLDAKYHALVERTPQDDKKRFSYWPYKELVDELVKMESGEGIDQTGSRISRHVFASQYQQSPVALGGNIIKSSYIQRYKVLPQIKYRKIYGDTAQKTKEANDFSVFECWGLGIDNRIYLLDMIRGKWEAPELRKRAVDFWRKHANGPNTDITLIGSLREMIIEEMASGTGLIQDLKLPPLNIPIKGIIRTKDKLTRVMDALPYLESGMVYVPEDAPFTSDFVTECESFTADDTHAHDDQIDPMIDAIMDLLSTGNKLKTWESLV